MMRFLRQTRLYAQATQACAEYSSLKRTEYRAALKIQRLHVRMRVIDEIQRSRMEALSLKMAALLSAAEISAARNVAAARSNRIRAVEKLAGGTAARVGGATLPDGAKQAAETAENADEYKRRLTDLTRATIPASARGVSAGTIVDALIADSVAKVPIDAAKDGGEKSVDLAVGLAREVGATREEVETILGGMGDSDTSNYLREKILPQIGSKSEGQAPS